MNIGGSSAGGTNIGGLGAHVDPATHVEMKNVQSLLVRLYFSDHLQRRYLDDRAAFLSAWRVGARFERYLPDVSSEAYREECRGRRILIAREVAERYGRTLELLMGALPELMAKRCSQIAASPVFAEFLGSEYFLSAGRSLPHFQGLGVGYEAVSKFFFWLEEREALSSESAPRELRTCAFVELGRNLVGTSQHSPGGYYDSFKHGVYFRVCTASPSAIVVVRPNGSVCVTPEIEPGSGLARDLDAFVAEAKARFRST